VGGNKLSRDKPNKLSVKNFVPMKGALPLSHQNSSGWVSLITIQQHQPNVLLTNQQHEQYDFSHIKSAQPIIFYLITNQQHQPSVL
jgi:hypothetical protein